MQQIYGLYSYYPNNSPLFFIFAFFLKTPAKVQTYSQTTKKLSELFEGITGTVLMIINFPEIHIESREIF